MNLQSTGHIVMVRPARFGYNEEAAVSNHFQNEPAESNELISEKVCEEFDHMVEQLRLNQIQVKVIQDAELPVKPDAVFPNNWFSMNHSGSISLFPMCTPNRRIERRPEIIEAIAADYKVSGLEDLTGNEKQGNYLEGTGSIVFDHVHKKAYACVSERTSLDLLLNYCQNIGYTAVPFSSLDKSGRPIYHTNVMMCIGTGYTVIVKESIPEEQRITVLRSLENDGLQVIDLTLDQMEGFAGNMLELEKPDSSKILICSSTAFNVLTPEQKNRLSMFAEIVPISIPTIERIGGGSVRCMMAENFLEHR